MVGKMMRWRPWPPVTSRKYDVKLTVHRFEGCDWVHEGEDKDNGGRILVVEIKWKGPKVTFRRTVKRNFTKEEALISGNGGVSVVWDEEFRCVCGLSGYKENVFLPWEIGLTVLHGSNQETKKKHTVLGSASLNLADYASKCEEQIREIKIPLVFSGVDVEHGPSLIISLQLREHRAAQEHLDTVQSPTVLSSPASSSENTSSDKEEVSMLKASLRKVKMLTDFVYTRKSKNSLREGVGEERGYSTKSEEGGEYVYPYDTDSLCEGEESDETNKKALARRSFSYETLAYANHAGLSFFHNDRSNNGDEDLVYYSNRPKSDVGYLQSDLASVLPEQMTFQSSKRSILLPWKKRKLSFNSKTKGEPLIKKAYAEEGGDDIDFDRRHLLFCFHKAEEDLIGKSSVSEFGDDNFVVGTWDQNVITSRDGHMKIQTKVFFASIDQRSERAAGESACTALVAVIADWLHSNKNLMPIRSQFDSLIREGSLQWRNLCENEAYMQRFPDRHFDLETVLQANVCDVRVVPEESFIGFFNLDEIAEGNLDFLHGAMSFDSIWEEINNRSCIEFETSVFVVSWNDHFFILKVEADAYYIIDTLGERLYEGCNQAYILKFDKDTTIKMLPSSNPSESEEKSKKSEDSMRTEHVEDKDDDEEEEVVCSGKESCQEYIKSFLASIPIRELQEEIKKGMKSSTPLHRLQIEFHFTRLNEQRVLMSPLIEASTTQVVDFAIN